MPKMTTGLPCPKCGALMAVRKTVTSGATVRRWRQCPCGHAMWTKEIEGGMTMENEATEARREAYWLFEDRLAPYRKDMRASMTVGEQGEARAKYDVAYNLYAPAHIAAKAAIDAASEGEAIAENERDAKLRELDRLMEEFREANERGIVLGSGGIGNGGITYYESDGFAVLDPRDHQPLFREAWRAHFAAMGPVRGRYRRTLADQKRAYAKLNG